jgi:hypothetical protein
METATGGRESMEARRKGYGITRGSLNQTSRTSAKEGIQTTERSLLGMWDAKQMWDASVGSESCVMMNLLTVVVLLL